LTKYRTYLKTDFRGAEGESYMSCVRFFTTDRLVSVSKLLSVKIRCRENGILYNVEFECFNSEQLYIVYACYVFKIVNKCR